MPAHVEARRDVHVGKPTVIESVPEGNRFGVVFEDDGDTGYFYGIDTQKPEQPILDALQIYDVAQCGRGKRTARIEILWSDDHVKAALLVDGSPVAVFDVKGRQAVCRTGFPPADGTFTHSHNWDESLLEDVT